MLCRWLLALLCLSFPLTGHASMRMQEDAGTARIPELLPNAALMADGYRLPLARWLPEGEPCRIALAIHGFNDFHQAFQTLGPALSADCVAVYAYDQRGFGTTEQRGIWAGKQRLVDDVVTMAGLLRENYPDAPLYLIGESMGAAVALLAMTREEPAPVEGAVLLAPAVWARTTQPWYMRAALWLAVRIAPGMRLTAEGLDIDASDLPEVLEYWRKHPLVIRRTRVDAVHGVTDLMDAALARVGKLQTPALILYGGNDEVVPPEPVCTMLHALPDSAAAWRFVYYPDGYHLLTRDSRAHETIDDIVVWLQSRQAPLPSGLELEREQAVAVLCE